MYQLHLNLSIFINSLHSILYQICCIYDKNNFIMFNSIFTFTNFECSHSITCCSISSSSPFAMAILLEQTLSTSPGLPALLTLYSSALSHHIYWLLFEHFYLHHMAIECNLLPLYFLFFFLEDLKYFYLMTQKIPYLKHQMRNSICSISTFISMSSCHI